MRDDAVAAIHDARVRVGVIGVDQVTTDLPEHADLNEAFPIFGGDRDTRTRGVAATLARPLTSAAEENLPCAPGDVYAGESILVDEFAHTVLEQGVAAVDATFRGQLDAAYDAALAAGTWSGSYAATDALEYWAEGVQSYFEVDGASDAVPGIPDGLLDGTMVACCGSRDGVRGAPRRRAASLAGTCAVPSLRRPPAARLRV